MLQYKSPVLFFLILKSLTQKHKRERNRKVFYGNTRHRPPVIQTNWTDVKYKSFTLNNIIQNLLCCATLLPQNLKLIKDILIHNKFIISSHTMYSCGARTVHILFLRFPGLLWDCQKTWTASFWHTGTSIGRSPVPSVMAGGAGDKESESLSQPN